MDNLLKLKEAPFVAALLFSAAAWCLTHYVDRILERPLLTYKINNPNAQEIGQCGFTGQAGTIRAIRLENISSSAALRTIEIYVTTSGEHIAWPLCWINTGSTISDGRDKFVNDLGANDSRVAAIDEMLIKSKGAILVNLDAASEMKISAKSGLSQDRTNFQFRKSSLLTGLVKYELLLLIALAAGFFWLAVVALLKRAQLPPTE